MKPEGYAGMTLTFSAEEYDQLHQAAGCYTVAEYVRRAALNDAKTRLDTSTKAGRAGSVPIFATDCH